MSTTNPLGSSSAADPRGSSTATNGQEAAGTPGTSLSNNNATTLSSNEFLDLMMTELENQNPLSPSSSDPTQYLTQLAQLTSVEQETDTAQNTQESALEQSVSQAVNLIGQTVTYVDQSSGNSVTGTVDSVQITSSGPSLTVDGNAGIDPAYVTAVAPTGSGTPSGTGDPGGDGDNSVAAPNSPAPDTTPPTNTPGSNESGNNGNPGTNPYIF